MKYRKKPVEVEARQWVFEDDADELAEWCDGDYDYDVSGPSSPHSSGRDWGLFTIQTLEGEMEVTPGDFIIKGVKGEFYPCKPDIFEQTYDKV